MRTRRTRRDLHPRRDQPGVLAVRDPHEDLDLARGEQLQQPRALVVGLRRGVQQLLEGLLQQLRRDRRLPRPRLHHGALHALDPLVVTDVTGGTGGKSGGDPARAGHRAQHHHRDLRPLLLDPYDRVEGAGPGGRGGPQQAHLGRPAHHQLRGPGARRGRRQDTVPAQLQRRGERLREQTMIVDHHEPHAHRATPSTPAGPGAAPGRAACPREATRSAAIARPLPGRSPRNAGIPANLGWLPLLRGGRALSEPRRRAGRKALRRAFPGRLRDVREPGPAGGERAGRRTGGRRPAPLES